MWKIGYFIVFACNCGLIRHDNPWSGYAPKNAKLEHYQSCQSDVYGDWLVSHAHLWRQCPAGSFSSAFHGQCEGHRV